MQNIPYELAYQDGFFIALSSCIAGTFGILCLLFYSMKKSPDYWYGGRVMATAATILTTVTFSVMIVGSWTQSRVASDAMVAAVVSGAEETYEVTLSEPQVQYFFTYAEFQEPFPGQVIYYEPVGMMSRGEPVNARLMWAGDEWRLVDHSGTELPRAGEPDIDTTTSEEEEEVTQDGN